MSQRSVHRPWRGSAWIFAAELLILPTGLVTAGFLTRRLGPEEYGLLTLAATAMAWLQWTASSMLARASNRAIAAVGDWRPVAAEAMHLHLLAGGGLGLLLFVVAPWMSVSLGHPVLTPTLRLLALELPVLVLVQGYRGVLVANGDHTWVSLISAVRWIVRMLAVLGLVSLGWSITGAVTGMVLSSVAALLMSRWRVGALHRAEPSARGAVRLGLLTMAAPIAMAAIGSRLFERADLFLLAALGSTATSLGHYGAAQNLTIVLSLLTGAVSPVVLATVTRMRRDGSGADVRRLQVDVLRLPFLVLPFAALAAGAAPEIMRVIYGAEFLDAAAPFGLLIVGATALIAVSVSTVLLVASDRAWYVVGLTAPMLVALVVCALVLVPRYGTTGAALASVLVSSAAASVGQLLVERHEGVHVPLRTVVVAGGLALVAYAAGAAWPASTAVGTVAKLVVICIALVSALLLLREIPTHLLPFVAAPVESANPAASAP
ncbi:oligosaccharide flippase family protein [Gemmatimonas sp.]|uniref:lipopolysaccharide biosynthesis protein n=1 Tax=Gemmatimonas sp. TaxID=1962908 RepID=UPI00286DD504|nr:oligosaccharide flippase family protein [Gemmatimonas sp.]